MTGQGQPPDIVVATSVDDTYLPLVWPLARSAARRLDPRRRIVLHVFHLGTDAALAARLRRLRLPRLTIELHPYGDGLEHLRRPAGLPPATYLRLLLPELLPTQRRAIYLDPDVLVRADLSALYDEDLGDSAIGGVVDLPEAMPPETFAGFAGSWAEYFERLVGRRYDADRPGYINAGVMLLDLERLRSDGFVGRALQKAVQLRDTTLWNDQDVINVLGDGRITLLDPKWNVMPQVLAGRAPASEAARSMVRYQRRNRAIVHFAGANKPWLHLDRHAPAWWRAALFSPAVRMARPKLMALVLLRRKAPRTFELLRRTFRTLRRLPGHT